MRDGFEEGDFVLIDPNLFKQYVPPTIEGFKPIGHPLDKIEKPLEAVITHRKEPKEGSKSYNYHIKILNDHPVELGEYSCLDDCFIMACQHCRQKMLYHDKLEGWFCPACDEIEYLSKKRRIQLENGNS